MKIEDVFENNGIIKFECGCKVAIAPEQVVRCRDHRPRHKPVIEEVNHPAWGDEEILICREPGHHHNEQCYQKRGK